MIGFADIVIWPALIFLTLPINILTLGLFTFVVNGMVLKICAAIFGSIVLAIVSAGLHCVLI